MAIMPSEHRPDLVRLAAAAQQALEQEGIRCQVLGDYLDGGIGDIPGFSAEVWVEIADLVRACVNIEAVPKTRLRRRITG